MQGRMALHLAGMEGSPARSKRTPEQQLVEFRVLDYLAEREDVREENLRGATRVAKALLAGMVRKKWIAREDVSAARDAARLVKVAVLRGGRRRRRIRLRSSTGQGTPRETTINRHKTRRSSMTTSGL